jgi:hypothetical protein
MRGQPTGQAAPGCPAHPSATPPLLSHTAHARPDTVHGLVLGLGTLAIGVLRLGVTRSRIDPLSISVVHVHQMFHDMRKINVCALVLTTSRHPRSGSFSTKTVQTPWRSLVVEACESAPVPWVPGCASRRPTARWFRPDTCGRRGSYGRVQPRLQEPPGTKCRWLLGPIHALGRRRHDRTS